MEYTEEMLDELYEDYTSYKNLMEIAKERFEECANTLYMEKGVRTSSKGKALIRVSKATDKLDVTMLSTLHEDRYKEIIESGNFTIPKKAYAEFRDEIMDCIETKDSTYYLLKDEISQ